MAGPARGTADAQPVQIGQPHVEDDQVGLLPLERCQAGRARAGELDPVARLDQLHLEQPGVPWVILLPLLQAASATEPAGPALSESLPKPKRTLDGLRPDAKPTLLR